ncbi:uncharacterized protein TRIADDRAFT_62176 [Trichoplax adhaerens]|uniref:EGF-like domain-containing protein n=1 Tax=Trichoplax adhaerens TaxID=10228 RepID=B3SD19_TRIAD|nr:hypothetical protein TRIADDRAFT_62176 [Trichoplax adhaerens]EDV19361.1 hypothetical protein TRIADDRAFT_62176 [Trichoplax adhaerens]|eukprot:XP_002118136.1 hypothetical protein TRIADDRAFT_62176 [Trichoplax adhaerens]
MFTGHQLVICLLIAFQFQATIGNINCDYQFIRNSCSSSSIACSLAKPTWRNAPVNHLVVWSISSNDSICQTPNACWQTNIQNCSYPEIQIKPLEIQDGDSVSLQILEVDNSSIVMNITNVTYYDFKRCSESYGLNRSDNILSGNGSIEIDSQMLRPGIHYFVSLLTENIYYCGFGYRQIIISRSNDCRAPGSPGNVKQCNGHGSCNVTSADNFLIRCQCDKDAIGRYCQEYNACYVNPCSNNASCHDIQGDFNSYDYNCSCQEGYTGKNCSDIIDYCQSNPCQNNNPCEPAFNGYSCRCSIAYYGTYCELYQDLCVVLNNPCSDKVGYQCVSNQGSYKCIRVAVPVSVQFYQVHPSCSFYRNLFRKFVITSGYVSIQFLPFHSGLSLKPLAFFLKSIFRNRKIRRPISLELNYITP